MSKQGKDHRAIEIETRQRAATPEYREQVLKNRKISEVGQCPKAALKDFHRAENEKARKK
jgi:hypothetical protein